MKKFVLLLLSAALVLSLCACSRSGDEEQSPTDAASPADASTPTSPTVPADVDIPDGVRIVLSDEGITVDGQALGEGRDDISAAHDIVYYESGHDFTYGEGTAEDEHSAEEAAAHTVLHISAPGTYVISGKLSHGQIAVDLGEDAEDDPEAVVNLVLDGLDITCTVAPAIIFYNVYECGDKDNPSSTVDTSAAGANIFLADGSENTVNGSYVARIYKSVELSEDGKSVVDSKKLHKYDGAVYAKMSMNVSGNDGRLTIHAENEGLDSELHLTVNGGVIDIDSGNDGINTNEDGVSVTTVNGGKLTVTVNGSTGEGDGIDSNGWLVINGGTVHAYACATSGDAGIDSDMGIILNGGEIVATGNMLDAIDAASTQKYVLFNLSLDSRDFTGTVFTLKDAEGNAMMEVPTANRFSLLLVSSPALTDGLAALYTGDTLVSSATPGATAGGMGRPGGFGPGMGGHGMDGGEPPEGFDGQRPEDGQRPQPPESSQPPENFDGQTPPEPPEGSPV